MQNPLIRYSSFASARDFPPFIMAPIVFGWWTHYVREQGKPVLERNGVTGHVPVKHPTTHAAQSDFCEEIDRPFFLGDEHISSFVKEPARVKASLV